MNEFLLICHLRRLISYLIGGCKYKCTRRDNKLENRLKHPGLYCVNNSKQKLLFMVIIEHLGPRVYS